MSRGSKYTKDDLEAAISEVIAGEMTQAEASLQYSIPKATLSDHIGRRTGKENKRSGLGVRGASSALAAQENVVDEDLGMSRRSSNNQASKIDSSEGLAQHFGCRGDDGEHRLEEKVFQLQETLKTFRAEVDLKMTIMEQILTTRNEQFVVQKKLLDREHALYETVLTHWKNTADLAANGLTLRFSDIGKDVDVVYDDDGAYDSISILGKRSSSSAATARRGRRKRLREKLKADSDMDESWEDAGCGGDIPSDNDNSRGAEEGVGPEKDTEEEEDGLERKVFVNFYSEEQPRFGERSNTPIWKHYLREENGKSAMCKLCDDKGIQKILKMLDGSTSTLHRHLKFTHKTVIDPAASTLTAASTADSRVPVDLLQDAVVIPYTADGSSRMHSPIWNYFTKFQDSEGKKARCNLCYEQGNTTMYKMVDGSTSRLHNHLKRAHEVDPKALSVAATNTPAASSSNPVESLSKIFDSSKGAENDDVKSEGND